MVKSKRSGARYSATFPTITNQLYQLAAGTVTSAELVRRSLDAINASQSTLNAFRVVLTEQAVADAAKADRKRAAGEQLPLQHLRDTYIGSLCGIAAPESFEDGLRKLGARIELAKRYIDHHRYSEAELQSFINRCIRRDLEMIVTTEKDAVRFPRLTKVDVPIYFLRVEIEILSGHESWEHCVARICKPQPMLSPARFFA